MNWIIGRRIPVPLGAAIHLIGIAAVHAVLPWGLSLLAPRHGWLEGRPGTFNLLGLIAVTAGFYFLYMAVREHYMASPHGWKIETAPHFPTPAYMLTTGPYRYSHNPIYTAYLAVWLGWIAFYGSLAILGAVILGAAIASVVVGREERGLEARFGDVYREYQRRTPRWLGKPKQYNGVSHS